MAKFSFTESKDSFYAKAYHAIGRCNSMANTLVDFPEVSRMHCVIKWQDKQWTIKDFSSNGVWINGEQLPKKCEAVIRSGDKITLAGLAITEFIMVDSSPPCDYLLNQTQDVIPLELYNLLPSELVPEIVVFYNAASHGWYCEYINEEIQFEISENEKFKFAECYWQLLRCKEIGAEPTALIDNSRLEFTFNISQDEEETSLELEVENSHFLLSAKAHNYLIALLARYKLQQLAEKGEQTPDLGWVPMSQLQKDLGLSESHLNIQVHRARKQFIETVSGFFSVDHLIERKRGKLRFSGDNFTIYKGGCLEGSSLRYLNFNT